MERAVGAAPRHEGIALCSGLSSYDKLYIHYKSPI